MLKSSWILFAVLIGFCHCSSHLDPALIDEASGLANEDFHYEDEGEGIEESENEFEEPEEESNDMSDEIMPLNKRPLTNIKSGKKYAIGRELAIGDYFEFNGRYNFGTEKVVFRIHGKGSSNSILQVVISPLEAKIALKTKSGKTVSLVNREEKIPLAGEFQLVIEIRTKVFKVFLNGQQMGQNDLPAKEDSTIDKAWAVQVVFDPDHVNLDQMLYSKFSEEFYEAHKFAADIATLESRIKEQITGMELSELKDYLDSDVGSKEILQLALFKMISQTEDYFPKSQLGSQWLISNREPLEMLMTSGQIENILGSLKVFNELFQNDPAIITNPLHLRWAIATALAHSNPISYLAVERNNVDWLARYWHFLELNEEGILMPQFNDGTAWQLRFVTSSQYSHESLRWGREHTSQEKIDSGKVGDMKGYMDAGPAYTKENKDGLGAWKLPTFYYYQPQTLEVLSNIGGVCGAVGRFNSAMAQAFGVPATTIGQPGHCAYIYWTGEYWQLRNSVGGGWTSTRHKTLYNPGYLFHMMEESQSHRLADYILSEKMRYTALLANPEQEFMILESATTVCPFNHDAWFELIAASANVEKISTLEPSTRDSLKQILLKDAPDGLKNQQISKHMTVVQLQPSGQSYRLYADVTEGVPSQINGEMTVEVELRRPSVISKVGLAWNKDVVGDYKYKLYAKNPHDKYRLMRTSDDEKDHGYVPLKKKKNREYPKEDENTMTGTRQNIKNSVMKAVKGWDFPTQSLLLETSCNHEDTTNCQLGLNEIWVNGTELASLDYDILEGKEIPGIDYDEEGDAQGWFEVEIGNMAVLRELNLNWAEGTEPDSVRVIMKGCSQEDVVTSEESVRTIQLGEAIGTRLRVETTGNRPILLDIQAMGADYNIGQLLKIKGWETVATRAERFLDPQRLFVALIEEEKNMKEFGEIEF